MPFMPLLGKTLPGAFATTRRYHMNLNVQGRVLP